MATDKALIFIDTNIFLDFYRTRGSVVGGMLDHIDGNHERIITTLQVEMEYKNNRQGVILEAIDSLKKTQWNPLVIPAFLEDAKPAEIIERNRKLAKTQSKKLEDRLNRVLKNPTYNDKVFRVLQRLFKANSECHLTREKKERHQVYRLARKRMSLGYPPRKKGDTSCGDAINWEWIIKCAENNSGEIIIVSRDSDFGILHNGECILNDWLQQEFKERLRTRRKVYLTRRLAEGFKKAGIKVSKKEEEEEEVFLQEEVKWAVEPVVPFGDTIKAFQTSPMINFINEAQTSGAFINQIQATAQYFNQHREAFEKIAESVQKMQKLFGEGTPKYSPEEANEKKTDENEEDKKTR